MRALFTYTVRIANIQKWCQKQLLKLLEYTRVNYDQLFPKISEPKSSVLLSEEFMMWHCLNDFQDFSVNQVRLSKFS